MALVWQDGEAIFIQRWERDCSSSGGKPIEVFRSDDFWAEPDEGGLADAVAVGADTFAVAWTLHGNVFVRTLNIAMVGACGENCNGGVMANNDSSTYVHRAEVRLSAGGLANKGKFAAVWSSWQQDGDGWGVFGRLFTEQGAPLGPERQLNDEWRRFQWRPQLLWCQSSLWALWANGTGASCVGDSSPEDCSTGPILRYLTGWFAPVDGREPTGAKEINLGGKRPITAAMACQGDDGSVVPLWVENGGRDVRWNPTKPPGAASDEAADAQGLVARPVGILRGVAGSLLRRLGAVAPASLSLPRPSRPAEGDVGDQAMPILGANHRPMPGAAGADDDQVFMVASSGLLVLLMTDRRGGIATQLLDYASRAGPQVFAPREFATGKLVRATWDEVHGERPTLVACYVTGTGSSPAEGKSSFVCYRRSAAWLAGADAFGDFGVGMTVALAMMLMFLAVFCMLRRCGTPLGRGAGVNMRLLPRAARAISPQLRDLRNQLAQIPREPQTPCPGAAAPAGGDAGGAPPPAEMTEVARNDQAMRQSSETGRDSGPEAARRGAPPQNECTICQNEVLMRVALRPCGHTACRDCVARLVESERGPRCHLCRADIAGVQPVYI